MLNNILDATRTTIHNNNTHNHSNSNNNNETTLFVFHFREEQQHNINHLRAHRSDIRTDVLRKDYRNVSKVYPFLFWFHIDELSLSI